MRALKQQVLQAVLASRGFLGLPKTLGEFLEPFAQGLLSYISIPTSRIDVRGVRFLCDSRILD
jgi:hypothetical protein